MWQTWCLVKDWSSFSRKWARFIEESRESFETLPVLFCMLSAMSVVVIAGVIVWAVLYVGVWIARSESSSLPLFHPRVLTWTALLLACLIFFIAIAIICSKNEKWQRMLAMQKARKNHALRSFLWEKGIRTRSQHDLVYGLLHGMLQDIQHAADRRIAIASAIVSGIIGGIIVSLLCDPLSDREVEFVRWLWTVVQLFPLGATMVAVIIVGYTRLDGLIEGKQRKIALFLETYRNVLLSEEGLENTVLMHGEAYKRL